METDCPRCGGDLEEYALGSAEECVCNDCGYVGIPFEHGTDADDESESWDEALERFSEENK